ncbi:MAG: hypothetical protein AVDCRST_MAG04-202, partial [uncultured Acetobacteraceae bacterium]
VSPSRRADGRRPAGAASRRAPVARRLPARRHALDGGAAGAERPVPAAV